MNLLEVKRLSWTEELYKVYELNSEREFDGDEAVLIPVSHSTAQAQIEITLRDDGTIVTANEVIKENATTIIPVTEDSGTRSSGICPMPFADKLIYIAGDFDKYGFGKYSENKEYYSQYIAALQKWSESENTHRAVNAVYSYLKKGTVISDLIRFNVLVLDESTGKLKEKIKFGNGYQEDSFVRFIVNYRDDIKHENRTWLDKSLYESFINYNKTLMNNIQLCYVTGTEETVTYKHPSKIRNTGDKAKLISSNDESGFSYRGRFDNKEQALSVGYEYSQKIHNALRWLIERQGMTIETMSIIVWASALQNIPDGILTQSSQDSFFSDLLDEENDIPDTEPKHREMIEKIIFGLKETYEPASKVMIMGVDAATTGRLSVSMYSEFESSQFYENIKNWHLNTAWPRFNSKLKKNTVNSFSLYGIIRCAFGTEQNGFITCKKEIERENILRLIPCVTSERTVPSDIITALFRKASNPLAYEKRYNHREVLETACGMIRNSNLKRGGITAMAYDPNEKNRSYLYGCLLAIADKAESSTYDEKDRDSRLTNARRYWNSFSSRPYITWKNIHEKLRPYLDRCEYRNYYEGLISDIMEKMSVYDFSDNSPLEPSYLLGYHHFTSYMYTKKNTENKD